MLKYSKIFLIFYVSFIFVSRAYADELTVKTNNVPNTTHIEHIFYKGGNEVAREEISDLGVVLKSEGKIPDGTFKEEYQDNLREISYSNGKLTGIKSYTKDGKLKIEDEFKDGVRRYKTYYPGGQTQSEGLINGDGTQNDKSYDVNGNLEFAQSITGMGVDTFAQYYPNGKVHVEGVINKKGGPQYKKYYDMNGNLVKEIDYENGQVKNEKDYPVK